MEGEVLTGMAAILSNVGSIVTSAIGWMGSFITAIGSAGNELLMVFVCVPLVGLGIGLIRRMISLN